MILKPTDHPKTHHDKNIGVLLINLGTPENTETKSIRIYLKEFLSDRRVIDVPKICLLYTSPSPRDGLLSRMPSSA